MESHESREEVPEASWFAWFLQLIDERYRAIIFVLVLTIAIGAGSFTAWASASSRGNAFVDNRIDLRVGEHFRSLDARVSALETTPGKLDDIAARLIRLETKIDDLKSSKE
jgi:hypothetical protein